MYRSKSNKIINSTIRFAYSSMTDARQATCQARQSCPYETIWKFLIFFINLSIYPLKLQWFHINIIIQNLKLKNMGNEQSNTLNCGVFENDMNGEIQEDEVLKVHRILQQHRNKYQKLNQELNKNIPKVKLQNNNNIDIHKAIQSDKILSFLEHQNILKFSNQQFQRNKSNDNGLYESRQISLAYLIQSRYNTKNHFPQDQVIKLLECIIYAMAFLQKKYIKHHDIYPTNIYYINNIFKLANPKSVSSSYSLTFKRQRFSYLSPELIMSLRQSIENISQYMLFRSDVFSLGMIMLQFCSLKPSYQCYDQQNYDIIDLNIKQRLNYIKDIYHPKIIEAIILMLQYQFEARISSFQLSRYTHQFAAQYINQQNINKKIEQGYPLNQIPILNHKSIPLTNKQPLTENSPTNHKYLNFNVVPNSLLYKQHNNVATRMNPTQIVPNNIKISNLVIKNIIPPNPIIQINQNILEPQTNIKYISNFQKRISNKEYQIKGNIYIDRIKQQVNHQPNSRTQPDINRITQQIEIQNNKVKQYPKQKQQSIDQRVKRILQKSKQIR